MKKYIFLGIIALIGLAIYLDVDISPLSKKMAVSKNGDKISVPNSIVPYMPAILENLKNRAAGQLCIEPPTEVHPGSDRSKYKYKCTDCPRFEKMGLIKLQPGSMTPDGYANYDLGEAGKLLYTTDKKHEFGSFRLFCLGDLHLQRIVELSSTEKIGKENYVFGTYTLGISNASPILNSPYLKQDDLVVLYPTDEQDPRTKETLYRSDISFKPVFPQNSSETIPIVFSFELMPNNKIGMDSHVLYNKWALESSKRDRLEKEEFEKRAAQITGQ